MNILITGCRGQLGTEICRQESQHPGHVFFNTDVQELDVTDAAAVEQFVSDNAIDGIVNCVAYVQVDRAEGEGRELAQRLNVEAPAMLASVMQRRGGWIVHVSTDYVFDGTAHIPYTEDMPTHPIGAYGQTKLDGELGVMAACERAMIVRTAWLYSPHGSNFVKTMIRLGRERDSLGVVFDQIGTPTSAHDLAAAILAAIEQGVRHEVYHFTDEGVASWYDFTQAIFRLEGITTCRLRPLHTSEYPTSAARPHFSVLDKSKIKRDYGIDIPHWEKALEDCLADMHSLNH